MGLGLILRFRDHQPTIPGNSLWRLRCIKRVTAVLCARVMHVPLGGLPLTFIIGVDISEQPREIGGSGRGTP